MFCPNLNKFAQYFAPIKPNSPNVLPKLNQILPMFCPNLTKFVQYFAQNVTKFVQFNQIRPMCCPNLNKFVQYFTPIKPNSPKVLHQFNQNSPNILPQFKQILDRFPLNSPISNLTRSRPLAAVLLSADQTDGQTETVWLTGAFPNRAKCLSVFITTASHLLLFSAERQKYKRRWIHTMASCGASVFTQAVHILTTTLRWAKNIILENK